MTSSKYQMVTCVDLWVEEGEHQNVYLYVNFTEDGERRTQLMGSVRVGENDVNVIAESLREITQNVARLVRDETLEGATSHD